MLEKGPVGKHVFNVFPVTGGSFFSGGGGAGVIIFSGGGRGVTQCFSF